ncbi:MAG TPA: hypothetical protein PKO15_01640 [Fibrobacteria bacterium]|nr:hypothetical protein [Fibrobacteria bacterium]HOX49864.1 hypothetical protein [Fibrobacteria bacterium]
MRNIAFCVDEADRVSSLESAVLVRVYERCRDTWLVVREFALLPDLGSVVGALDDCFALVCGELGEADEWLERSGVWVWELRGDPEELAEVVWRENLAA